jgi:hypothetical protein
MKLARHLCLALCGLALACGDDSSGGSGDDDSTSDTGGTATSADGPGTNPTMTTNPDETGPADTTAGPVGDCERTRRYPLYGGQACGRVLVGAVDTDTYADIIAFGHGQDAVLEPAATTLQTFLGGRMGLDNGEVHCCLEASLTGDGAVFDINGDGDGDPLWASTRQVITGDVGESQWTFEKSIRAPEHGYTGDGVLFADADVAPPFTIGRITADITGVIVVADGALISLVGNGDGLGLEPTNTLVLDPVPVIRALATIELDGQAGVDVVGVGPDGLLLWGGSVEGVFADATVIELPGEYTHIESIDVDLDGNRELVLFGVGEPIALVDRGGMIEVSTAGMPSVPPPATVIEVDGDMYPDVVGVEGGNLVMYPGDGDVFGEAVVLAPIGAAVDLAYGDFDGNGLEDVVACDEQGLLVVYRAEE